MGVLGIYWNLRVHVEKGSEGQRERERERERQCRV